MRRALALVLVGIAACASGTPGNPDAKEQKLDAPAGTPDSPVTSPDAKVDAVTPVPDARVIDANTVADANTTPDASTTPDAMTTTDGGVLGTGDTCAMPNVVGAQTSFTYSGDLTGLANDIEPMPSCTGYDNDGPDAIFVFQVGSGKKITASVNTTWDASVEITTNCAISPNCVAGEDGTAGGGVESTNYTTPSAGTYYVIVDSWDVSAYGPYTLTVNIQ
ncbi:MAG TPA: hypothetical protein VL463_13735 [Kofleriaceae bacterium]|jgi:hypothetical protein|nr:hypothetical protein [Kofleriaceae bacterium]